MFPICRACGAAAEFAAVWRALPPVVFPQRNIESQLQLIRLLQPWTSQHSSTAQTTARHSVKEVNAAQTINSTTYRHQPLTTDTLPFTLTLPHSFVLSFPHVSPVFKWRTQRCGHLVCCLLQLQHLPFTQPPPHSTSNLIHLHNTAGCACTHSAAHTQSVSLQMHTTHQPLALEDPQIISA